MWEPANKMMEYVRITVFYLTITLVGFTIAFPFFWGVLSSLQSEEELWSIPPILIPHKARFENYLVAMQTIPIIRYILNSFLVCTVITILGLLFGGMAGYVLAKFRLRGQSLFLLFVVGTLIIPYEATIIPLFAIVGSLQLADTYIALVLPNISSAYAAFFFRQFIQGIPDDLIEAARLDGVSELGIYWRIILPNAKPAIVTSAIILFVTHWNELLWPLIVINSEELKTVTLGLATAPFAGQAGVLTQYHLMLPACILAILPIFLVYLFLQKYIIRSVALSGLKF